MVPSLAALTPPPAVGLAALRRGGHAAAQAPVQALLPLASFWKRYRVRPFESTRILPRLPLLTTPTVGALPDAVGAGTSELVLVEFEPQAASVKAASGTAATARRPRRDRCCMRRLLVTGDDCWGGTSSGVEGRARNDEAALVGEGHELRTVACGELAERTADVRLGGCGADDEVLGDLEIAHPTGHERDDLELPARQLRQLVRAGARGLGKGRELVQQNARDHRRHDAVAGRHRLDRLAQLARTRVLEHELADSCTQRAVELWLD